MAETKTTTSTKNGTADSEPLTMGEKNNPLPSPTRQEQERTTTATRQQRQLLEVRVHSAARAYTMSLIINETATKRSSACHMATRTHQQDGGQTATLEAQFKAAALAYAVSFCNSQAEESSSCLPTTTATTNSSSQQQQKGGKWIVTVVDGGE
jgi:hypothetical protein